MPFHLQYKLVVTQSVIVQTDTVNQLYIQNTYIGLLMKCGILTPSIQVL